MSNGWAALSFHLAVAWDCWSMRLPVKLPQGFKLPNEVSIIDYIVLPYGFTGKHSIETAGNVSDIQST